MSKTISGRTFEQEASIPMERYFDASYFNRKQFDSLISQLLAVNSLSPSTVLEIGPGNGIVSDILRKSGRKVTTFDINENLRPDVVGNIVEIDKIFDDNSFDLILCAEVLEHLPFEHFDAILEKFSRIAKKNVVITLPRNHRILLDFVGSLKLPFIPHLRSNLFLRLPNRQKWSGHHWEVDFAPAYSLATLKSIMSKYFSLKACYVDERNRTHQFFILGKA
jgi:ubiquinone/menaquinone biosynthesis C-methylase UbiE